MCEPLVWLCKFAQHWQIGPQEQKTRLRLLPFLDIEIFPMPPRSFQLTPLNLVAQLFVQHCCDFSQQHWKLPFVDIFCWFHCHAMNFLKSILNITFIVELSSHPSFSRSLKGDPNVMMIAHAFPIDFHFSLNSSTEHVFLHHCEHSREVFQGMIHSAHEKWQHWCKQHHCLLAAVFCASECWWFCASVTLQWHMQCSVGGQLLAVWTAHETWWRC